LGGRGLAHREGKESQEKASSTSDPARKISSVHRPPREGSEAVPLAPGDSSGKQFHEIVPPIRRSWVHRYPSSAPEGAGPGGLPASPHLLQGIARALKSAVRKRGGGIGRASQDATPGQTSSRKNVTGPGTTVEGINNN